MRLPLLLFLTSAIAYAQTTVEDQGSEIFLTKPIDTQAHEGDPTTMNCVANENLLINKCRWTWKSEAENSTVELQVDEFSAFGDQGNDCSMILTNVTLIQQGLWTCVLLLHNQTIYRSSPALLSVEKQITFQEIPQNNKVMEDNRLILTCSTEDTIQDCHWLFRLPNTSEMVQVALFKAIKNQNCTIVIEEAKKRHTGHWLCGVRKDLKDGFLYAKEAYVLVEDKEITVNFAEAPVDTVFAVGSNGSMQCTTLEKVQQCRWFWQPQGYSDEWQVLMKDFPAADDHDCSLHFKDVTTEPEGIWMCAVLPYNSSVYFKTKPVTLRIKTLIDFSVLTRAVVVAEGMETSLRCQTDSDVEECRWRWHQLGEANAPSVVVTSFPPYGPTSQDCSIQFTNMLMEQQGVWVCGVRLRNEDGFKEAMPTTVSLKPAGRVRILEISQPITIAETEHLNLKCITSASVNECVWEFTPTNTSYDPEIIEFLPLSKDSRNCSLSIINIEMKHDGLWKCSVEAKREKGSVKATTDPLRVIVIKPANVTFENVANVIHASPGSNCQLACQVSHEIDMCRWKFLGKSDVIKAEFPPVNGTDCTLNLLDLQVLNSGFWQCGVKNIGQYHYVWAPPTTLNVLHTENITTSYWISESTNQLSLACHLETQLPMAIMNCHWYHPSKTNTTNLNDRNSYNEYFDESSGDCILEFHSHASNPGIWQCLYTVDTENGTWKLGEAKFVVISNPHNLRLRLIVGILAAIAVIMAIVLGIVIIYGCPWTTTTAKDKLGKPNNPPPVPSKQSVRYTEEPGKINFNFQESPKLPVLVDLSLSSSSPTNHVYERVGQYVSPTVAKSIYQNIK